MKTKPLARVLARLVGQIACGSQAGASLLGATAMRHAKAHLAAPPDRGGVPEDAQANVALPLCLTPAGGGLGAARPWGCSGDLVAHAGLPDAVPVLGRQGHGERGNGLAQRFEAL